MSLAIPATVLADENGEQLGLVILHRCHALFQGEIKPALNVTDVGNDCIARIANHDKIFASQPAAYRGRKIKIEAEYDDMRRPRPIGSSSFSISLQFKMSRRPSVSDSARLGEGCKPSSL
ncbi:hypothetical protein [Altererythrobacter sp. MTPC7]|uniref:hypothetical protein n=1 Tax=Altererythrobacter sp. MTPC7 TaxID=3056567 RepID=UPI0036F33D11